MENLIKILENYKAVIETMQEEIEFLHDRLLKCEEKIIELRYLSSNNKKNAGDCN